MAGGSILERFWKGRRKFNVPDLRHVASISTKMAQTDISGVLNGHTSYGASGERGSRRRKLAGYLKAANELRQSYQQAHLAQRQTDGETDLGDAGIPGAFPDVAIARHGDEEMLLFPSYTRHHVKKGMPSQRKYQDDSDDSQSESSTRDAEYWKREWDNHENDNALVDVDVRGWIYSPRRGPMTRKNRLLLGLARQLSGVPASSSNSRDSSRGASIHDERAEYRIIKNELELVEKEAQSIMRKGAQEASIAGRGGYSETPETDADTEIPYTAASESRTPSPSKNRDPRPGQFPHPLTNDFFQSDSAESSGPGSISKRASWNQPSSMSPAELSIANANLMARLKPFLTDPLINTPVTFFFYNDQTSQSRTVSTNEQGHFSIRAPLGFIPSHVRVLASEKLSATEEVRITEPKGVNLISDIDDTIKHSAIGSGAKEIFRNTFIRDLEDLTIEGVSEWYTKMANMGVDLHYVSNAPWQLYPVLVSFFALAGLPRGSFHLKQYTGMLQGIFEPVAERKKGTLEQILRDFPERRFVLVGDSGEADLELYTEIVLANPGRVLGIFIRDVTTSKIQGFFDSSVGPLNGERGSRSLFRSQNDNKSGTPPTKQTYPERKPMLPPRSVTQAATGEHVQSDGPVMGTLIDFDDPDMTSITRSSTNLEDAKADRKASFASAKSLPPNRPSKPLALRSTSSEQKLSTLRDSHSSSASSRKAPPPPPKPRRYSISQDSNQPTEPSPLSQTQNISLPGSRATSLERQSYRSTMRNKVASAYNALPSPVAYLTGSTQSQQSSPTQNRSGGDAAGALSTLDTPKSAPPIPPRRNLTSYPVAAAQYASNRLGGSWGGYYTDGGSDNVNGNPAQPINKKEELWKRRWARAKDVLDDKGVMLKSWKVGADVIDDVVTLVEKAKKEK